MMIGSPMRIDVNTFLGSYPWRDVPGTSLDSLRASLPVHQIDEAWVSHLPALFWKDPMAGNGWLADTLASARELRPVPAVHPGLPAWEETLGWAMSSRVPAVRADPMLWGLPPDGEAMRALVHACGARNLPLLLAVRLEDGRQRHPLDHATDLPAAAIRHLLRADDRTRFLITHADRDTIEQVHFGSTPAESARVHWDISWVWGPPEDHLETLLTTIGAARFVFGTGRPLRLPDNALAKLDLLDLAAEDRARIESGNVLGLTGRDKQ